MSEKDDLKNAVDLLLGGDRKEASTLLFNLELKITDKNLRMWLIDASLSAFDPIEKNEYLIRLAAEGVNICRDYLKKDLESLFMARKAELLMIKVVTPKYQQKNLKLSSDWIEFSIETDRQKYEKLTAEIKTIEDEVENLLKESFIIASKSNDQKILGRVLMIKASIEGSQYLDYKTSCFIGNSRVKLWLKLKFLRNPFFENLIIFKKMQASKLTSLTKNFIKDFLAAAKIFEDLDDSTAGYAYSNLANNLKIAYKFNAARKYLKRAEEIALKHKDLLLQQQVKLISQSIKAKNTDIPDYLNQETR